MTITKNSKSCSSSNDGLSGGNGDCSPTSIVVQQHRTSYSIRCNDDDDNNSNDYYVDDDHSINETESLLLSIPSKALSSSHENNHKNYYRKVVGCKKSVSFDIQDHDNDSTMLLPMIATTTPSSMNHHHTIKQQHQQPTSLFRHKTTTTQRNSIYPSFSCRKSGNSSSIHQRNKSNWMITILYVGCCTIIIVLSLLVLGIVIMDVKCNMMKSTLTLQQQQQQSYTNSYCSLSLFSSSSLYDKISTKHPKLQQQGNVQQRSFPKWGSTVEMEDTMGIRYDHIHEFILSTSRSKQQQHVPTLDHDSKTQLYYVPETLYIVESSTGIVKQQQLQTPNVPKLYISNVHRLQHDDNVINDKLNHTERIMLQSLQLLHTEYKTLSALKKKKQSQLNNDNYTICEQSQWPILCETLYGTTTTTKLGDKNDDTKNINRRQRRGFPFFAWYGDYIGCNYQNWLLPSSSDTKNIQQPVSIPLYTVAADVKCNYNIPFPNYYHIKSSMHNSTQWDHVHDIYNTVYPYQDKISQIIWRGSLTGRIDNNQTKCPRWKLVETTYRINHQKRQQHEQQQKQGLVPSTNESTIVQNEYIDMFNVEITSIPKKVKQYQSSFEHDIGIVASTNIPTTQQQEQHIGDIDTVISFTDFQKYRAILDIDGHSWSGRFGSLLCFNSIVLKVDPQYVDYFYSKRPQQGQRSSSSNSSSNNDDDTKNSNHRSLQPWVHYIPITSDFSNLEEMGEYVLDSKNDDTIQSIIQNANEWCRTNMIESVIAYDMLSIWDRYVQLLNINDPNWMDQYINETIRISKLFTNGDGTNKNNKDPLQMIQLHLSDYKPYDNKSILPKGH